MEEQKEEPPVLPVGSSSGASEASGGVVNVRVDDVWHVSTMPEEKQYFSQDVSALFILWNKISKGNVYLHPRKIYSKLL